MFHLSSKDFIPKGQAGHDQWYKIRQFYDSMNLSFKQHFIPDQNSAVDESMIWMKNQCSFIQYMANNNNACFGIKKFEVCDSQSSYVLHSEMYTAEKDS